uniref:Uncharacterized protein n=1 Tax=Sparus aurata TaxID=8175 RepID=A0A671U8K0_SPAAU
MEKTQLVSELKRWCRGGGLDETHALMTIVPEDVEISKVEETLETTKSLGRVFTFGYVCPHRFALAAVLILGKYCAKCSRYFS